jgi:hypothetical protein
MKELTRRLWAKQEHAHPGDRFRLYSAVHTAVDVSAVLYPGSYVDLVPSFWFDDVTYVDIDARAAQFFGDAAGVDAIIREHRTTSSDAQWQFVQGDFTTDLGLRTEHYDLLVSLYAGFVSEHCTRYLRPGGYLLANSSHGDVAMAAIDHRYRLCAVVTSRSGRYAVSSKNLDTYLQPQRDAEIDADTVRRTGRGVAYTKTAFAYLFQRIDP